MRKELVIFVPSTENGVEVSLRDLKIDKNYVVFDCDGNRFAVPKKDVLLAINELDDFTMLNPSTDAPTEQTYLFGQVEFTDHIS